MVFPLSTATKLVVEGKEIYRYVPRQRFYPEFSKLDNYVVYFQSNRDGPKIKIRNLAKNIYEKFPLVSEIQFVNNGKFKIKTNSLSTANEIISNKEFQSLYKINVPFDLCEVKGVAPIPCEYSEEELFNFVGIKHKPEFGVIDYIDDMSVLEVRRLTKRSPSSSDPKNRIDIDKVVLTFSGSVLPSHVKIDGIVYPISSYTEPVLQCYKCFRFKHTTKACNTTKLLCRKCSKSHSSNDDKIHSNCNSSEFCTNCKGPHPPLSRNCPLFTKLKKANEEKSKKQQPKKTGFSSFFSHEAFPPLGTNKQKKKRFEDQGPPSITDPPPSKRSTSNTQNTELSDASSESFSSTTSTPGNQTTLIHTESQTISETNNPVDKESSQEILTLSPPDVPPSAVEEEESLELPEAPFTGFDGCNDFQVQTDNSTQNLFPLGQRNIFDPKFNHE